MVIARVSRGMMAQRAISSRVYTLLCAKDTQTDDVRLIIFFSHLVLSCLLVGSYYECFSVSFFLFYYELFFV